MWIHEKKHFDCHIIIVIIFFLFFDSKKVLKNGKFSFNRKLSAQKMKITPENWVFLERLNL